MRPRGGGGAAAPRPEARSGAVRRVYEDFTPMSEWKQEDESHILDIYLPGFMKEQIKVSTEGRNTIRVLGERLVAGNKWNRFLEDFLVPENGEMRSVRAKFEGGVLTITVPKVKVDARPPKEGMDNIKKQPTPQKGQEKALPEVSTQATDEKGTEPQKSSRDTWSKWDQDADQKQSIPQKGQDKGTPVADTRQSTDEPEKIFGDPKKEHDQRGKSFSPLTRTADSHDTEKGESGDSKEKHIILERPDGVRKITVDKEGKEITGSKELSDVETAKRIELEKDGATRILEKNTEKKELYGAFTKEKYKKTVKGLAELNEQRQLLVNMGVAMLVIVALAAYITYNFASAKDRN